MRHIFPFSIVVTILSSGAFVAAFFVIPQFAKVFSDLKLPIPTITEWILEIPHFCWLMLALMVGALVLAKDLYIRKENVAKIINIVMALVTLAIAILIVYSLFLPLITMVPTFG